MVLDVLKMSSHSSVPHSFNSPVSLSPSGGGKYCLGERKRYRSCNTDVSFFISSPPCLTLSAWYLEESIQVIWKLNCRLDGCSALVCKGTQIVEAF